MGRLLSIKDTASYLNVSQDTLRKWDKANKLKPLKTAGGHRRYDTDTLDDFIGKEGKQINYGDLYEHLCSAQYIADVLQDEHANQIMTIRQEVGEKLLKIHEDNAKCYEQLK